MKGVGGTLIAITYHCGQDLLIITGIKGTDQGKGKGKYAQTEDSVGVVMDTTKVSSHLWMV